MCDNIRFVTVSLVLVEINKAFCLDVAQGRMNGVANETRTYSWKVACLAF